MKKLIWIVPLVLIVACVAGAWFIGGSVEKNIDEAMESVAYELSGSASPDASFLAFTTKEFDRGILSSTATTEISPRFLEDDEDPIVLTSKIYHGPLMFTADGIQIGAGYAITTLDMDRVPDEMRKILEKGFDDEPPIKIATKAGFGGDIASDVSMPHFRHSDKEDMGGMTTETTFQMAGLKMNFAVPGGDEGGAKGTMKTGEMKMTQKMQMEGGEPMVQTFTLGLGEGSFENTRVTEGWHAEKVSELNFPEFSMDFGEFGISLKDVSLKESMNLDASGRKFDGSQSLSFASGSLTGAMAEQAGDQEPFKEILTTLKAGGILEMTSEGLDAATLADLEKMMGSFFQSLSDPLGAMGGGSDGEDGESMDPDAAMKKVLALFQPGTKVGIRQKLGEGEKRNELSISLGFVGKPATEAETLGDFVNGLRGEVSLRLSKTLVATSPLGASVEGMIQGGMVEDRGDYYRAIGELADGKVSLNGTELPVMDQFAPMMEAEFSIEGLMEVFMGMGMGGMGPGMEPDMEGGFPGATDAPGAPATNGGAAPNAPQPDAPSPNATPAPAPDAGAAPVPQ